MRFMRLNKRQLVERVCGETVFTVQDIRFIVDRIFGEIGDALANGDRVSIERFGRFHVKVWKGGQVCYIPNAGGAVVKMKAHPGFKASLALKLKVAKLTPEEWKPEDEEKS